MSGSEIRGSKKAGLSGLFRACAVAIFLSATSNVAAAETLVLEVQLATADYWRVGAQGIEVSVTDASRIKLARFTQKYVGRKVAVRIDGQTLYEATINEPLFGGQFPVSGGSWTAEYAKELAQRLSKGTAKIELVSIED